MRTIEDRLTYIRDKIISRRVGILAFGGAIVALGSMIDWEKSYECRSAARRVANSSYCYADYSKQYKPVAMRADSVIVYGTKEKTE